MLNEPDDVYEREADRIASQVPAGAGDPTEVRPALRVRPYSASSTSAIGFGPASVNEALSSPGRPLEPDVRHEMEQRFGHDFSKVRVHADTTAERSADELNAHAYTVGRDIVFGAGKYSASTLAGRSLIAHELTHTIQQSAAPATAVMRSPKSRAPVLEPGTGFDGVRQIYGNVVNRSLSPAQVAAVKGFRAWMEAGFSPTSGYAQGSWAREAAARTAAFPGNAEARATLYAEMQRQIVLADGGAGSSWYVSLEKGADGSYIFRGNPNKEAQRVFIVDPDGNCHVGLGDESLQGRGAGKSVNYTKLRTVNSPAPAAKPPPAQEPIVPEPAPTESVSVATARPPLAPMTPPARSVSGTITVKPTTPPSGGTGGAAEPLTARSVGMEVTPGVRGGGGARGIPGGGFRGGRGGRGSGFGFGAVAVEIMYPELRKQAKAQARKEEIAYKLARYDQQIHDRLEKLKPDIMKSQLTKEAKEKVYLNVVYEVHNFEFSVDVYLKSVDVTTRNLNSVRSFSAVRKEIGWATGKEYHTRRDVDEHTYSLEVWVYSEEELETFGNLSDEYLRLKRTLMLRSYDAAISARLAEIRNELTASFGSDIWFLHD